MPGPEKQLDDPVEWDAAGAPTATAAEVIIREARVGLPAEIAAQFAQISLRTYRTWISEGRAVLQRISAQPDIELNAREARIAQFATDVYAAQAFWVRNANVTLERAMRTRTRTTTKVKKASALVDGKLVEYEAEVTTTTADEPIELGPLMWRLSKLAPAAYGPMTRVELSGPDGGAVTIDIGTRVKDLLERISGAIEVQEVEPAGPEQLVLEPGEPEVGP